MTSLKLWISSGSCELYRTEFTAPVQNEVLRATRGKTRGAMYGYNCFQWTPAVKALTVLLLRTAAHYRCASKDAELVVIEGGRGSPAASLDYALAKQTSWLFDVFGKDRNDKAFARRLFRRSNPSLKRPGPVAVSVNRHTLTPQSISVFSDECEVTDAHALENFADSIESSLHRRAARLTKDLRDCNHENLADVDAVLEAMLRREMHRGLNAVDVFSDQSTYRMVSDVLKDDSFTRLAGASASKMSALHNGLSRGAQLGVADDERELKRTLCADEPIRVAVAGPNAAVTAIFRYMKVSKGYNIELSYQFPHAVEIVRMLRENRFNVPPDLIVLGVAPAASVIGTGSCPQYSPFMFAPNVSQRIVIPKDSRGSKPKLNNRDWYLLYKEPSIASFFFEDLRRVGFVRKNRVEMHESEQDQATKALSHGSNDIAALMWFPHYELNAVYNKCEIVPTPVKVPSDREMIFFVHDRLRRHQKRSLYFNIAIRDAWLELKANRQVFDRMHRLIVSDQTYMKFVKRCAGLHYITEQHC